MFQGLVETLVHHREAIRGRGRLHALAELAGQLDGAEVGDFLASLVDEDEAVALFADPGQLDAHLAAVLVAVSEPAVFLQLFHPLDPAAQARQVLYAGANLRRFRDRFGRAAAIDQLYLPVARDDFPQLFQHRLVRDIGGQRRGELLAYHVDQGARFQAPLHQQVVAGFALFVLAEPQVELVQCLEKLFPGIAVGPLPDVGEHQQVPPAVFDQVHQHPGSAGRADACGDGLVYQVLGPMQFVLALLDANHPFHVAGQGSFLLRCQALDFPQGHLENRSIFRVVFDDVLDNAGDACLQRLIGEVG